MWTQNQLGDWVYRLEDNEPYAVVAHLKDTDQWFYLTNTGLYGYTLSAEQSKAVVNETL